MANLNKLSYKRSLTLNKLVKIRSFIEDKGSDENIDHAEVSVRYKEINNIQEIFNNIQDEIINVIDTTDANITSPHEQISDEFDDLVNSVKVMFEKVLQPRGRHIQDEAFSSTHFESHVPQQVNHIQRHRVQLPKITLPTFNGNYCDWLIFKETFISLIHGNNELSAIEKFHYLLASLKDDARKIIDKLTLTEEGYNTAWELLSFRFDNSRMIVDSHIKRLLNLKNISQESSSSLLELTDEYTMNLRALKTLAERVDFWDSIIICVVTSRLPSDTISQWELTLGECEVLTLPKLTQFLKSCARIRHKIESNASNYDSNNRNYNSTINKTNSNSSSSKS